MLSTSPLDKGDALFGKLDWIAPSLSVFRPPEMVSLKPIATADSGAKKNLFLESLRDGLAQTNVVQPQIAVHGQVFNN